MPLYELLHQKLLEQHVLHADETSYRVLESDSQLTYYCTFLSGKDEKEGITLYHHDKCRRQAVLPGSKLGRAIEYSLKYEETFRAILKDGSLDLSNNIAEREIKSLVMGRKNWLFSQSFEGAKSSAIIMSLLATAKRHHLDSKNI